MRIFGSQRLSTLMQRLGMEEGEAIEHSWVTKAIENAQRKVEGRNFDIRKQLLEYDDVANDQRKVIYAERANLMEKEDISESIANIRDEVVNEVISGSVPPGSLEEQWDVPALEEALYREFNVRLPISQWLEQDHNLHEESLRERIVEGVEQAYRDKMAGVDEGVIRHFEREVMLNVVDMQWKEHLAAMDHLRQGIGLRGYAQKNPKQEYKREAYLMFSDMLERIKRDVIGILSKVEVEKEEDVEAMEAQRRRSSDVQYHHPEVESGQGEEGMAGAGGEDVAKVETFVRQGRKVGRNEPCPCGSGKKYKHCHGKLD
jgi:preprotein translocase subunit SecA